MPIYKYLSHEQHARSFMRGNVILRPLSHFCYLEDGQLRGDRHEGLLSYAPKGGLEINKADGTTAVMEGWRFMSQAALDDIFVFCASGERSADIAARFDNSRYCIEIDPQVLIDRLTVRARDGSDFDYQQLYSGAIDYVSPETEPNAEWALPERIAFRKPDEFAWQSEYRIALGRRGAFDVHNVACTLQTGPVAPPARPTSAPVKLRLGDLTEHARLHRL